jgi:hypothetical protein
MEKTKFSKKSLQMFRIKIGETYYYRRKEKDYFGEKER